MKISSFEQILVLSESAWISKLIFTLIGKAILLAIDPLSVIS